MVVFGVGTAATTGQVWTESILGQIRLPSAAGAVPGVRGAIGSGARRPLLHAGARTIR